MSPKKIKVILDINMSPTISGGVYTYGLAIAKMLIKEPSIEKIFILVSPEYKEALSNALNNSQKVKLVDVKYNLIKKALKLVSDIAFCISDNKGQRFRLFKKLAVG